MKARRVPTTFTALIAAGALVVGGGALAWPAAAAAEPGGMAIDGVQPRVERAADGVYEIDSLGASSSDGVISVDDGAVTVDMAKVPSGNGTVVVKRGAIADGTTSVRFTPVEGDVRELAIDDWALAQQGFPTLTQVVFPDGLDALRIGASAFYQYSSAGSTALGEVVFPRDVVSLTIGESAFRQDAREATTLKTVAFPTEAKELVVGDQAFRQKYGTSGGLESVTVPGGLDRLDLGQKAFSLSPSYGAGESLRGIHLDFADGGAPGEARLASGLTDTGSPLHSDPSTWLWLGSASAVQSVFGPEADAADDVRDTAVEHGFALRFDGNAPTDTEPATGLPSDMGFAPMAGSPTPWEQTVPSVAPVRAGFAFDGWNTSADGSGTTVKPGDRVRLEGDASGMTLYAMWTPTDDGGTGGDNGGGSDDDEGSGGGADGDPGSDGAADSGEQSGGGSSASDASDSSQNGSLPVTGGTIGAAALLTALLALAAGILLKRRHASITRTRALNEEN